MTANRRLWADWEGPNHQGSWPGQADPPALMARFDAFWEVVCEYRAYMWMGLTALVFLFVLSLFGLVLAPPGTGAEAISYVNIGLILVTGACLGGIYRVCLRRRR